MPFTLFKFPTLFGRKQSTYKLHGRAVSIWAGCQACSAPWLNYDNFAPFNEAILHN